VKHTASYYTTHTKKATQQKVKLLPATSAENKVRIQRSRAKNGELIHLLDFESPAEIPSSSGLLTRNKEGGHENE
jgi:hypothetical protein